MRRADTRRQWPHPRGTAFSVDERFVHTHLYEVSDTTASVTEFFFLFSFLTGFEESPKYCMYVSPRWLDAEERKPQKKKKKKHDTRRGAHRLYSRRENARERQTARSLRRFVRRNFVRRRVRVTRAACFAEKNNKANESVCNFRFRFCLGPTVHPLRDVC